MISFLRTIHAAVCESLGAGPSATAVVQNWSCHHISAFASASAFKTRPHTGRPRPLSTKEERYIVRLVRRLPKVSRGCRVHIDIIRVFISTVILGDPSGIELVALDQSLVKLIRNSGSNEPPLRKQEDMFKYRQRV